MKWLVAGTLFIAAIALISLVETVPDSTGTPSLQAQQEASPSVSTPGASPEQRVSIAGCVRREAGGRGVPGREFVLTNAAMIAGGSEVAGTVGSDAAVATNTSVYRLTGANEAQVNQYVGARVEIVGVVTGGSPAGVSPGGIVPGGGSGGSLTGSGVGIGSSTGGAAGGSPGGPSGGSTTGSTGGSTTGGASGSAIGSGATAQTPARREVVRDLEVTSVRPTVGPCAAE